MTGDVDQERLMAYYDGELSPEESAEVERLLAEDAQSDDPQLAPLLDSWQQISNDFSAIPAASLEENFAETVLKAAERRMVQAPLEENFESSERVAVRRGSTQTDYHSVVSKKSSQEQKWNLRKVQLLLVSIAAAVFLSFALVYQNPLSDFRAVSMSSGDAASESAPSFEADEAGEMAEPEMLEQLYEEQAPPREYSSEEAEDAFYYNAESSEMSTQPREPRRSPPFTPSPSSSPRPLSKSSAKPESVDRLESRMAPRPSMAVPFQRSPASRFSGDRQSAKEFERRDGIQLQLFRGLNRTEGQPTGEPLMVAVLEITPEMLSGGAIERELAALKISLVAQAPRQGPLPESSEPTEENEAMVAEELPLPSMIPAGSKPSSENKVPQKGTEETAKVESFGVGTPNDAYQEEADATESSSLESHPATAREPMAPNQLPDQMLYIEASSPQIQGLLERLKKQHSPRLAEEPTSETAPVQTEPSSGERKREAKAPKRKGSPSQESETFSESEDNRDLMEVGQDVADDAESEELQPELQQPQQATAQFLSPQNLLPQEQAELQSQLLVLQKNQAMDAAPFAEEMEEFEDRPQAEAKKSDQKEGDGQAANGFTPLPAVELQLQSVDDLHPSSTGPQRVLLLIRVVPKP
ncbi:Hypothetical protein PBC10988_25210 [Planctomycetales bacterium 10988]|nr:Hypothetical protein PBC10988_25210 [Planctomycetales bacterium 10988]